MSEEKNVREDSPLTSDPEDIRKMDMSRKKKKTARAALSFIIMAVLLVVLIFASVNIGSLQVSPSELFRGLFIERIENVAAIYDLRFPRIVISLFAGAAVAVSGVLFQAVLKNPLAEITPLLAVRPDLDRVLLNATLSIVPLFINRKTIARSLPQYPSTCSVRSDLFLCLNIPLAPPVLVIEALTTLLLRLDLGLLRLTLAPIPSR